MNCISFSIQKKINIYIVTLDEIEHFHMMFLIHHALLLLHVAQQQQNYFPHPFIMFF